MGDRRGARDPTARIGRVYSCTRPLVYRALAASCETDGLAEVRATTTSDYRPGPDHRWAPRAEDARAFRRWRSLPADARPRSPLGADAEAAFSATAPASTLGSPAATQQAVLARTERALERQLKSATGFGRTLVLWRLSVGRAALSFVEGAARQPRRRADRLPPDRLRQLAARRARRHAAAGDRGHGRRVDCIEIIGPHRGCLADLDGFSHVWVVAHLHEGVGWEPDSANVPRQRTAWNVRDALATSSESARALARPHRQGGGDSGRRRRARPSRRHADSRPQALRAAVRYPIRRRSDRLVRAPRRRVFTRRSDDRFARRSRRASSARAR